jgi:sugar transferase (PEP-CTERM/EpsH1 system associated)
MLQQIQDPSVGVLPGHTPRDRQAVSRCRVLHVIPRLGLGGTEKGMLKVMRGLGETDFEHRICAVRGIDAEFARCEGLEAKAYSADSGRPGFQFPLWRLKKIMQTFRPHIVHSRNFGALEAVPAARLAGVPVVIHSEHGYELEILRGLPLRRRLLCRAFYRMADQVLTVTDDLRRYHAAQSGLPPARLRVIYNGVDTQKFSGNSSERSETRASLAIPRERFVAGTVGRLVPIKDQRTLLQAAQMLVQRGQDIHVLLVGDGPELGNLKRYAAEATELAGRVTFTGASDTVTSLMRAMDAFVLPSICEGMSNTILEAMACGVPVVATRMGGNPELVKDGRSGFLFAPRDVNQLSALLLRMIENERERLALGEGARLRAVESFSIATMVDQYRELYRNLGLRKSVEQGH